MKQKSLLVVWPALLLGGCATTHSWWPIGEWRGQGSFLYRHTNHEDVVKEQYPTTLRIKRIEIDGERVIRLDVQSDRGEIPGLGNATSLTALLRATDSPDTGTSLYKLVDLQINPQDGEEPGMEEHDDPERVTCRVHGTATTCIVDYMENFVEIFRFDGRQAEKMGTFFDPDEGFIHWYETLRAAPGTPLATTEPWR